MWLRGQILGTRTCSGFMSFHLHNPTVKTTDLILLTALLEERATEYWENHKTGISRAGFEPWFHWKVLLWLVKRLIFWKTVATYSLDKTVGLLFWQICSHHLYPPPSGTNTPSMYVQLSLCRIIGKNSLSEGGGAIMLFLHLRGKWHPWSLQTLGKHPRVTCHGKSFGVVLLRALNPGSRFTTCVWCWASC